ncbi:unnamed protein product [Rotaria sp. Silwood2]|nr:unnamed protein product [Rotaria sp. Silwood2]CAF4737548.1 unnamed protein product [Rotaria sp. Silwood2]
MRAPSGNTTEESMDADLGDTRKTFINTSSQTEDFNVTFVARSDSINMIVDSPTTATMTASDTALTTVSTSSSVPSHVFVPFYHLSKSHSRCPICNIDFSSNSPALVFTNDIRARAFLEDDILISFGSRCCEKHISAGYLNAGALQRIRKEENKCYLTMEEFIDMLVIIKNAFLLKVSTIEDFRNAPLLNFDDLTRITSDNYYVLTGLSRANFDNLCSRIPSSALRNTPNRSARTAIACLLMKLRLGISHQVLATLFSFKDKRTVSRVVHSARKALAEYFVPHFLGFEHIKRRDVIDRHTRPLASELLADQPDRAILILDGTYIYFQKSANNVLQRRTYSMHKGKSLIKPMLITTTTGYIVSCMGPYFADYKNNDAEITKHIIYKNKENIGQWLEKGDILVVDRGFRDALDYLHLMGYQTYMPSFLAKGEKQFTAETANQTRFVTKVRWVIESANGRIKQWRIFDKVLPNSLLKTAGDLIAIVCALQNCYGAPFIQSISKDKELAKKMLKLRDETNELGNYVAKLKNKSEKLLQWKELNANDTVPDFPRLTFEELNDLTLGELIHY